MSPRCLLWASNTVFSTSRQRGKKEENGLVSSEPSLSRHKATLSPGRHQQQSEKQVVEASLALTPRREQLSNLQKMFCLQTLRVIRLRAAATDDSLTGRFMRTTVPAWPSLILLHSCRHWVLSLFGDVLYKNLGHGLNVVTIPADQQQFAKHSDLQPGR